MTTLVVRRCGTSFDFLCVCRQGDSSVPSRAWRHHQQSHAKEHSSSSFLLGMFVSHAGGGSVNDDKTRTNIGNEMSRLREKETEGMGGRGRERMQVGRQRDGSWKVTKPHESTTTCRQHVPCPMAGYLLSSTPFAPDLWETSGVICRERRDGACFSFVLQEGRLGHVTRAQELQSAQWTCIQCYTAMHSASHQKGKQNKKTIESRSVPNLSLSLSFA